jgi:hypothetical protein
MAKNDSSLPQDFTSAVNLTLKPAKILVVALGLVVGIATAILASRLGAMIKAEGLRWLSWLVQRSGALIFAYVVLAAMCSATAMAHAESRNERMGVGAGWASILRNLGPVVLGTLKPILVFICSVAIIWAAGALGAIPQAGPIIWAIISVVPLAAGLLAIFVLVKLVLVSFVFPAALSVNRASGAACYKESSLFIKKHVAHFLGRLGIAAVLCLVFYRIVFAGFGITAAHSSRTMGNNKVTLNGSRLFEYVAAVPGISGTAPRGFGLRNPALPFLTVEAPAKAPEPDVKSILRRGFAGGATAKTTHKVGGWIFSFVLLVFATIPLSIPLIFFALSGYRAFVSLKDADEIPLETEALDLAKLKETAEPAGKAEMKAPPREEKRASRKRASSSSDSEQK